MISDQVWLVNCPHPVFPWFRLIEYDVSAGIGFSLGMCNDRLGAEGSLIVVRKR